jgi:hypothetical protein
MQSAFFFTLFSPSSARETRLCIADLSPFQLHSVLKTLEQIAFVFTKCARGFWMPACAGMTEETLQECHSRESGNPVHGKRIGNLL